MSMVMHLKQSLLLNTLVLLIAVLISGYVPKVLHLKVMGLINLLLMHFRLKHY